jgi:hypothetical protein
MTIERIPHPDNAQCWEALENWISLHGRMPNGDPISPSIVKVMAVGAWIGCRFALIHPPFALSIAETGNQQTGPIFEPLQAAVLVDKRTRNLNSTMLVSLIGVGSWTPTEPDSQLRPRTSPDATNKHLRYEPGTARGRTDTHASTSEVRIETNGDFGEVQR